MNNTHWEREISNESKLLKLLGHQLGSHGHKLTDINIQNELLIFMKQDGGDKRNEVD